MSHERHGDPDHRSFECLLNNLFRQTSENHRNSTLLALCEGNPHSPSQKTSNAEGFPFYDVFMLCLFLCRNDGFVGSPYSNP